MSKCRRRISAYPCLPFASTDVTPSVHTVGARSASQGDGYIWETRRVVQRKPVGPEIDEREFEVSIEGMGGSQGKLQR